MSGQAERYSFIRDKSGLSNKGFAESLGISTSMSSQISTGRVNFPRDLLPRLTAEHGVNLHWFLTGDGRSGLAGESDFVEIELLEQEAAAGQGDRGLHRKAFPSGACRFSATPQSGEPKGRLCIRRQHDRREHQRWGHSHIQHQADRGKRDICRFRGKLAPSQTGGFQSWLGGNYADKRKPRRYSGTDLEDIRIVGRVVACYHRM